MPTATEAELRALFMAIDVDSNGTVRCVACHVAAKACHAPLALQLASIHGGLPLFSLHVLLLCDWSLRHSWEEFANYKFSQQINGAKIGAGGSDGDSDVRVSAGQCVHVHRAIVELQLSSTVSQLSSPA